jgi:DNA-binding transcriptional ArsR family regulator
MTVENIAKASLPGASGRFNAGDQEQQVDQPRRLDIAGNFSSILSRPKKDEAKFSLSLKGDVVGIQQDFSSAPWILASPLATAVGVTILGTLAAALYLFRELVLDGFARAFFPLYSKLHRGGLLEHGLRESLLTQIRESPGITHRALRETVRPSWSDAMMGEGTLEHHLRQLRRFGFITQKKVGRNRRYFVVGEPQTKTRMLATALVEDLPRTIARIISRQPGIPQARLYDGVAASCNVSLPGLRYHLVRLEREGLIRSQINGRRRLYHPMDALAAALGPTGAALVPE